MTPTDKVLAALERLQMVRDTCNHPSYIPMLAVINQIEADIKRELDDMVIVPVEPTCKMLNDAVDVDSFRLGDISPLGFRISPQQLFKKCYAAMIAPYVKGE